MVKKSVIAITCLWIVLLSLNAYCGQATSNGNVNEIVLKEAQADQKVALSEQDVIVIKLETLPATGFKWRVASMDTKVLRNMGASDGKPEIECPEPFVPGNPCTQVMRFAGKTTGKTRLDLVYEREWEKPEASRTNPDHTYSLNIEVAKPFRGTYTAPRAATEQPADPGPVTAPGLPTYFNWADQGVVTPIKDQGTCGSCWAFGATAVVESQIARIDGVQKDLSEQYLVSCNNQGSSCGGGWWTYDYFIDNPGYDQPGAVYENDFPYAGYDAYCNAPYPHHEKLTSWAYVDDVPDTQIPYIEHNPTTAEIKQKLYSNGPVGTVVCSNTWGGYYGGVFYDHCSTPTHIVMITGWDDAQGVFFIKNSWGTSWGESGYMRLPYGYCLVGYQSTYASYGSNNPNAPIAVINGPYSGEPGIPVNFSSAGSNDPDGTIVSYLWDFGDGATSTQANPTHTYAATGTYTVKLTVTDNSGLTGSAQTQATIGQSGQYITAEQEPNGSISTANGPVGSAQSFTGGWGEMNDQDFFYFDVNTPGTVNIKIDTTGGTNTSTTFVVYHESNPSAYVAYDQTGAPNMSASFTASQTGRYYIVTYTWSTGGTYQATVTW